MSQGCIYRATQGCWAEFRVAPWGSSIAIPVLEYWSTCISEPVSRRLYRQFTVTMISLVLCLSLYSCWRRYIYTYGSQHHIFAADPALSGSDSEEVVGVDVPSPPETQSSRLASSRDTSARVRFCCCTNSFDAKRCTPSSAIQYRPRVITPVTDNKKMIAGEGSGARNGKSNASSSWSANLRSAVEHHGRC